MPHSVRYDLKAPFPWFGGKRKVAQHVWDALGDVHNYIEPFAGSLAVLLGRPKTHRNTCETVNDADLYLVNFWRALKRDPEKVARFACDPVNEADLFARHMWLVNKGAKRIARLNADPDYYDAKVAGWWVWGLCLWIGSGWCSGKGSWRSDDVAKMETPPSRRHGTRGVHRKRPHLGDMGQGVNRQLPHLGDMGRGKYARILAYMLQLADRLEDVRVCCGDWARVVTDGAMAYGDTIGVFLDPPYLGKVRTKDLYSSDDHNVAADVRKWAVEHGDDPRLRIVLAGYEDEHIAHIPSSWRMLSYKVNRAYGNSSGDTGNSDNRSKERLWLSPHCLTTRQGFGLLTQAPKVISVRKII